MEEKSKGKLERESIKAQLTDLCTSLNILKFAVKY